MSEPSIEENLKARGFEAVGKSGVWNKFVETPMGKIKVNPGRHYACFHEDAADDDFENRSDVPELAEVQALVGMNTERPSMGQKLKEAMDNKSAGASVAKQNTPAGSNLPQAAAGQGKPALKKDFVVGAFDGLPETMVMKMGDKPYVTKAGLNFVAKKLGITVKVEPVRYSFEKRPDGQKIAIFKGIATTADGREYVDYGIASMENTTSMIVKGGNLDHMASTRASNRALRLATACGYCSVEELPEPPQNVIDAEFSEA